MSKCVVYAKKSLFLLWARLAVFMVHKLKKWQPIRENKNIILIVTNFWKVFETFFIYCCRPFHDINKLRQYLI